MRRMAWRTAATLLLVVALGACTVVPVEEARRIRDAHGGQFDATAYVAGLWTPETISELRARAVPLETLQAGKLDELGKTRGTRAGEGSPWTFVTQASGVVKSIARDRPRGALVIAGPAGDIEVQTGPVVSGTAIRDAIPAVNFDDFPDQIAFAEVGQGLTDRAIAGVGPALARLRPGERVNVLGVVTLAQPGATLRVTPLAIERIER